MDNPVPSTSKETIQEVQAAKRCNKRRKASRSSSSSTSSSSSSESSSSSNNARKRKSKRKRKNKNRKFDKLFEDISRIKQQLYTQPCHNYCQPYPHNEHEEIDCNISGDLFEGESHAETLSEPTPEAINETMRASETQAEFSLSITTKTKEPHIPQASPEFVDQLIALQRFNHEDWKNVRYLDVQKQYVHKPGFVNLQANDEVARYDTSPSTNNMEKAFAGITYGLLKQRDALQNEIRNFLAWARQTDTLKFNDIQDKLQDIFSKGEFVKVSNDTLQLVCGHRAELIQKRRETILSAVKDSFHKSALRKVPPSANNLFEAEKFSAVLEKAGGTKKVFWETQKDRTYTATQNDPTTKLYSNPRKPPPKSENYTRPTNSKPHRGTFQSRGGRGARGRRDDTYNKGQRPRSPVSHRDRGGHSKGRKY